MIWISLQPLGGVESAAILNSAGACSVEYQNKKTPTQNKTVTCARLEGRILGKHSQPENPTKTSTVTFLSVLILSYLFNGGWQEQAFSECV